MSQLINQAAQRPFSQACENNKAPILSILKSAFAPAKKVLEIGSGTGQHAVHFAANLPSLMWQPSDRSEALPTLKLGLDVYQGRNLLPALSLDMRDQHLAIGGYDAVFSANTAHIMPWELCQRMITEVASSLPQDAVFALYGPFNYGGQFSSESNARFDLHLQSVAAHQGIRDFEKVNALATNNGLTLVRDHAMPANNQLIVWKKL